VVLRKGNTVARSRFAPYRDALWPILRDEGFKGAGNTLRRLNGDVVHVFNIQGSSGGDCCYLNLGAHLGFLPGNDGAMIELSRVAESGCLFRDRIDPPNGASGWSLVDDSSVQEAHVDLAVREWHLQGLKFFAKFREFPASFSILVNDPQMELHHPHFLLNYARIAEALGDLTRAVELVSRGREAVPDWATALTEEFGEYAATLEAELSERRSSTA
jgi:hypothetical protein